MKKLLLLFLTSSAMAGTTLREQSFSPINTGVSISTLNVKGSGTFGSSVTVSGAAGNVFILDPSYVFIATQPASSSDSTQLKFTGSGGDTYGLIAQNSTSGSNLVIKNLSKDTVALVVDRSNEFAVNGPESYSPLGTKLAVYGSAIIKSSISVEGPATFLSSATIAGAAKIDGVLTQSGASNHIGASTFQSSVTVNNSITYSSAVFINSSASNRAVIIGADGAGTGQAFIKAIAVSNNANTPLDINPNGGGVTLGGTVTVGSGGTPLAVISTGTWGPVLSNFTNLDSAVVVSSSNFVRVGNIVTCFGSININPTATLTPTQLQMSLPIASDFTLVVDLGGTSVSGAENVGVAIQAEVSTNKAVWDWTPADTANRIYPFHFSYVIK